MSLFSKMKAKKKRTFFHAEADPVYKHEKGHVSGKVAHEKKISS